MAGALFKVNVVIFLLPLNLDYVILKEKPTSYFLVPLLLLSSHNQ